MRVCVFAIVIAIAMVIAIAIGIGIAITIAMVVAIAILQPRAHPSRHCFYHIHRNSHYRFSGRLTVRCGERSIYRLFEQRSSYRFAFSAVVLPLCVVSGHLTASMCHRSSYRLYLAFFQLEDG